MCCSQLVEVTNFWLFIFPDLKLVVRLETQSGSDAGRVYTSCREMNWLLPCSFDFQICAAHSIVELSECAHHLAVCRSVPSRQMISGTYVDDQSSSWFGASQTQGLRASRSRAGQNRSPP